MISHEKAALLNTKLSSKSSKLVYPPQNLVDLIWKDKPQKPREAIFVQPLEFSGTLITEKRLQHAFDIDWRVFPQAEKRT